MKNTPALDRILAAAAAHAQFVGNSFVGTDNLIAAIMQRGPSWAIEGMKTATTQQAAPRKTTGKKE